MTITQDIEASSLGTLQELVRPSLSPAPLPDESVPFPATAKKVEPSAAQQQALMSLATRSGSVQVTTRRMLTPKERQILMAEQQDLTKAAAYIAKRKAALSIMIRHHADATAEEAGRVIARAKTDGGVVIVAASERAADGHYQLASAQNPYQVDVAGSEFSWSLEYRAPVVAFSQEKLDAMLADGSVTRAEYLAFTREVRALDNDRALGFIRKSPGRGMEILTAITTQGPSSTSLNVRKSAAS